MPSHLGTYKINRVASLQLPLTHALLLRDVAIGSRLLATRNESNDGFVTSMNPMFWRFRPSWLESKTLNFRPSQQHFVGLTTLIAAWSH